jgi:hypothetical protein
MLDQQLPDDPKKPKPDEGDMFTNLPNTLWQMQLSKIHNSKSNTNANETSSGTDVIGLLKKAGKKIGSKFSTKAKGLGKKDLIKEGVKQVLSGGGGGGGGGRPVMLPQTELMDPYKKPQSTYEKLSAPPQYEGTITTLNKR